MRRFIAISFIVIFNTFILFNGSALANQCHEVFDHSVYKANVAVMAQIERRAWSVMAASQTKLLERANRFPEGQFISIHQGQILGFLNTQRISAMLIQSLLDGESPSTPYRDHWSALTDNGTLRSSHSSEGNILFLINVTTDTVLPQGIHRSQVGEGLIKSAKQFARKNRILKIVGLTRLNGLQRFTKINYSSQTIDHSEVDSYIHRVEIGLQRDPSLSFHLRQGARVLKAIPNAMADDIDSLGWGALIEYQIDSPIYREIIF